MRKIKCWDCEGAGSKEGFAMWSGYDQNGKRTHGGGYRVYECARCKGAGEVVEQMLVWKATGEKLLRYRLKKELSAREMAKILKLPKNSIYYDAEKGYIDPTSIIQHEYFTESSELC